MALFSICLVTFRFELFLYILKKTLYTHKFLNTKHSLEKHFISKIIPEKENLF